MGLSKNRRDWFPGRPPLFLRDERTRPLRWFWRATKHDAMMRRFEAKSCELSYSHITTAQEIKLDMFTCRQGFWRFLKPHHSNKYINGVRSLKSVNFGTTICFPRDFYPRFHVSRQASHNSEGAQRCLCRVRKKISVAWRWPWQLSCTGSDL